MATRELSWYKPRNCWKKKYRGSVYYLSKSGECKGPNDRQGYENALRKWLDLKAKLDGTAPAIEPLPLPGQQQAPTRGKGKGKANPSVEFASDYSHRPKELKAKAKIARATTIEGAIEEFLQPMVAKVERKDRAKTTLREMEWKLDDFKGFAAHHGYTEMKEIDELLLEAYREQQLALPDYQWPTGKGKKRKVGKPISPTTAQKRLAFVRRFMEWANRLRYIDELPRNIDAEYVAIDKDDPDPHPFTLEEVKQLYGACSDRVKLYFLLGLNLGYGQTDIATLTHDHVLWDQGIINRKRNKTGSPQCHKLWKVTQRYLKKYATEYDGDPIGNPDNLVLLTVDGKPLQIESIDAVTAKTNPIGLGFKRAVEKLAKKNPAWKGGNKGIKRLRKTGAQWIADNYPKYPHIVKQYLGHKEKDVVRHYMTPNYDLLFEALDAMEGYFNLK